jgi:inhibitor of KinA sporulation pathway (predicted exonuclease)
MFVIYDLEYTTWEGAQSRDWTGPGEFREIVQMGALRVSNEDLLVEAEFEVLVEPRRNPDVSDFFEQLTGVSNSDIKERGVDYLTALNRFLTFCDGSYALSYGNDMVILGENAVLQIAEGMSPERPLPPFVNIRPYINSVLPQTKHLVAGGLSEGLGVVPPGDDEPKHDALLDCYSILDALRYLRKSGEPLFLVD